MSSSFSITPFNGDKKNYWTFVCQLNVMFLAEHTKFNTDKKKTLFALNQMKGGYAEELSDRVSHNLIVRS